MVRDFWDTLYMIIITCSIVTSSTIMSTPMSYTSNIHQPVKKLVQIVQVSTK